MTLDAMGELDYAALHRWSIADPRGFWTALWRFGGVVSSTGPVFGDISEDALHTMTPPKPGEGRWFSRSRLNFAENLLKGSGHREVLVSWDETGRRTTWTRTELKRAVAQFASGLRGAGVQPGDRVAGFLPTIPESVVAFLATVSIGAVWTSCSPDFGTGAVLDRFGQTEPKVLVGADRYRYKGKSIPCLPRLKEIAERLPTVKTVVVAFDGDCGSDDGPPEWIQRHKEHVAALEDIPGAVVWDAFGEKDDPLTFPEFDFDHPLVILYSSGTTGLPKCIVHGAGGTLLQHLKELTLHTDLGASDRFFYYTTCGWMMWNWLVSGLATGATLVLYSGAPHAASPEPKNEANPRSPDILWTMAEQEDVSVFGVSAKYLALMEKHDVVPQATHDLQSLRTILSTGSPLSPQSYRYVYRDVKKEVHLASISGGTDIVSCFVLGVPTEPVRAGEIQGAGLGMAMEARTPSGERVVGTPGELVCTQPFPSMPVAFWNDPDGARYRAAYFEQIPGVWRHGDWAEETPKGGWIIHGRSDATLNPGGVRIGTAEIYRQVEAFPEVLEAVAVGREIEGADGARDVAVILFLRMADGVSLDDDLRDRIHLAIRNEASPHHVPRRTVEVPDIPRTVSGKLSEIAVREAIHGRAVDHADALANPASLDFYRSLTF